jgi:hypothetical protein
VTTSLLTSKAQITRLPHRCNFLRTEALLVPKDTRWDRNLPVAPDREGLIGHAGAVLLRKLADDPVTGGAAPGTASPGRGQRSTCAYAPVSNLSRGALPTSYSHACYADESAMPGIARERDLVVRRTSRIAEGSLLGFTEYLRPDCISNCEPEHIVPAAPYSE